MEAPNGCEFSCIGLSPFESTLRRTRAIRPLGLPAPIVKGVRAAGYTQPTPILQRAIPIVLAGHDLVGAAQTGTGKRNRNKE
jgi:superfamily II DNA/RNA helicase